MAANDTLGLNQVFQIYHEDESAYEGLVMHKSATDSVVMSLGDSITGDVYWRDNELELSMKEYVMYNGVKYVLVNPPTIVREGMVADNSELKGMTKYSFKFYHPMYQLGNFPFSDVAVTNDQKKYLSENKVFSWIGTANDYLAKLNKNLEGTQWMVEMSSNFPNDKKTEMSDVLAFDKNTVADALKTAYDTWGVPYVIDVVTSSEASYNSGKRFKVVWGLPSNEIYENATKKQQGIPYIFKMGKGVGLKNNSRTPRNNKIITRIAGYGSETNIPYGYPQIVWTGNQSCDYTINNISSAANSYPIYDGIVGGQKVRLIKHPFTRTHLMPNVYVDAVNKKVNPNATGYDPDIELKDYYDATAGEDYPNPINLNAPSYDIHEFDDIKPELGSESIVSVTPLNPDLTPASSWDDTMDDDGKFIQSYFQITLPTLSFDIYACAAITEAMEINMRSGACLGCTFPVEVDWEDYKANFYNEDGEFDPVIHSVEGDGHVRNGKKYPNSSNSSTPVTLILKKENTTFGVLMPNTYQHPATGDTFVVLGISLPTSYITSAQTRLDDAMKSYMLENNVHYYDYPLKFDEAFLRNNMYILGQLKQNAIVRFEFAGETMPLYVKQMNVKFGEGVLPKYDITLTDNVEVVLNQIGQVADDVERLSSLISILRQSYGSNVWVELAKKLSKTDDDTAQGFIRFVKGLQVGERFDSGLLGEGGVFRKDADGTTYIEADKLYIRMKAYFDTVEIRKYMHSGGNRIASPAGAKCVRVENMAWYAAEGKFVPVDENGTYRKKDINDEEYVVATGLDIVRYRCYFRGEDNDGDKVTNDFLVGDQAYCHITNGGTASLQMHHYWRLIVARNTEGSLTEDGEFWIDLANYYDAYGQPANLQWTNSRGEVINHKSHQAGSDIPRAQDDIVQLGSADDVTRQGAVIEYSSGEDSPSYKIYQNIDDFSFEDTNFIALGYNTQTGRAYMNVYGDAYIGDPDESTFIKYEQEDSVTHRPKMTIRAEVEFQDPDDPTSITTLEQFANTVITGIDNIQSQIDGELDTWYYAGVPTLNNLPASQWPTDDLKKMHVGDLYYDKNIGYVYRFIYDTSVTPNVYKWIQIHDDAISEALKQAEKAQDTADHKRRVFVTQPPSTSHPDGNYVEYDVGDLWANATGTFTYVEDGQTKTVTYNNDLLRCRVSKPIRNASGVVIDGTFSITDWELATRYTDDTKIDAFLDGYQGNLTAIRNQVDQKAETYYEDNDPSTNQWGSEHVGDMWFCTSDHADPSMFKKGTTWVWQEYTNQTTGVVTYAWAEAQIPQVVFDTLDRKKAIYVAWNAWITTDSFGVQHNNLQLRDLFIPSEDTTGGGVQYKANRVYRCVSLNPTTFQEIDYVDNQDWSNWIQNTYNQNISNIENQIDKKAETWYQNTDPSTTASPNGWYGEDNAEHVGDLWLVSIDVTGSNIYKAGTTWYFKDNGDGVSPRYTWEKQVVPQEVFDYADGKAAIFVGNPPTTYNINDMWFIGDGVSSSQLPTGCVAGDVVVSSAKRTGVYNKADWAKKDRYTDDTKFNTYISQIINGTSDQSDSAVVAQALHAIKAALNENTTISGGLILTSLISLKSNSQVWAGISGLYDANETGGGIAAWYGGGRVDHETYPSSSDYAKSLFRFDGSGYMASGNITWNAAGAVTIKNITTLSDSQNTNILNELATFNNAFTFSTSGQSGTTVLSITPQVPFTSLSILDTSVSPNVGRPVATQKWVSDNYISITFFNRLFQAYSSSTISDANKVAANDITTTINNLKIMVGAWTNQYLSALGINSGSSGGGGDVYWSALASSVSGATQQIHVSHLAMAGVATQTWVNNAYVPKSGDSTITGTLTATGFAVPSGQSNEVLLADGTKSKLKTVNGYSLFGEGNIDASGSIAGNYLPLAGGTLTGRLNVYYGTTGAADHSIHIKNTSFVGTGTYFQSIDIDVPNLGNGHGVMGLMFGKASATNQKAWLGYKYSTTEGACLFNLGFYNNDFIINILSSGNVGIGKTNPTRKLDVNGSIGATDDVVVTKENFAWHRIVGSSYDFGLHLGTNGINRGIYEVSPANSWLIYFDASNTILNYGNVGIGTTSPATKLEVNGDVKFSSTSRRILILDQTGTNPVGPYMQYDINNTIKVATGFNTSAGYFIDIYSDASSYSSFRVNLNSLTYKGKKVWWEDNDGSGSGLDADFLDGLQSDMYMRDPWNAGYYDSNYTFRSFNNTTEVGIGLRKKDNSNIIFVGRYNDKGYICLSGPGDMYYFYFHKNGKIESSGFKTRSGTSSQFLKADGSVDSQTYLLSSDISSWAKASTKPSYNLDEVPDGSTRKLANYVPISNVGTYALPEPTYNGAVTADTTSFHLYNNSSETGIGFKRSGNSKFYIGTYDDNAYLAVRHGTLYYVRFYDNKIILPQTVGIGTSSPSYKLHVKGRICAEYDTQGAFEVMRGDYAGIFGINSSGHTIIATGQVGDTSSTVRLSFSPYDASESYALFPSTSVRVGVSGSTFYDGKYVQIGAVRLVYDSTNNAIKVIKHDGTAANFYATGSVAAFGANTQSGGNVGDVTWAQLANSVSGGNQQIHISHLAQALVATQSWVTNQGYLSNGNISTLTFSNGANNRVCTINNNGAIKLDVANVGASNGWEAGFYAKSGNTYIGCLGLFGVGTALDYAFIGTGYNNTWLAVKSNGNVGIGTNNTNPSYKLHVNGTGYVSSNFYTDGYLTLSGILQLYVASNNTYLTSNGRYFTITVGSASHAVIDYDWRVTSDMRRKDVIKNVGANIEQIADAPIFYYRLKNSQDTNLSLGSSAQYWQQVFQNAVSESPDGFLSMNYSAIALASAVITARKVLDHEGRIRLLEVENQALRKEIEQLKKAA